MKSFAPPGPLIVLGDAFFLSPAPAEELSFKADPRHRAGDGEGAGNAMRLFSFVNFVRYMRYTQLSTHIQGENTRLLRMAATSAGESPTLSVR